jgi:hypothetical protein
VRRNKTVEPKTIAVASTKETVIEESSASKISVVIESKDPSISLDRIDLTLTISSRHGFFARKAPAEPSTAPSASSSSTSVMVKK